MGILECDWKALKEYVSLPINLNNLVSVSENVQDTSHIDFKKLWFGTECESSKRLILLIEAEENI